MIPIEKQVCSLELAQKLKELGVKKKSIFTWGIGGDKCEKEWTVLLTNDDSWSATENYQALTVAEIFKGLPVCCSLTKEPTGYQCIYFDTYDWFEDENPANACVKMLIYLIEKGILKAEDL